MRELDRIEIEGTTVAAVIQVILDCYGDPGRLGPSRPTLSRVPTTPPNPSDSGRDEAQALILGEVFEVGDI